MIPKEVIEASIENFKEMAKDMQPARYLCYRMGIEFAIAQIKPEVDRLREENAALRKAINILSEKIHDLANEVRR